MLRAIFFVIFALFIAFAASWLSAQEGVSTITWLGYRVEIDTSLFIVAIFGLCLAGIIVDRLVRAVVRWPSLFSEGWQARRRAKGDTALSLGFVALAAGDNRAAHKQARRAQKLLDKGVLTDLLVAQSSYGNGDSKAASRYFKKLAATPETAYFGQLGLMRLHQQNSAGLTASAISTEALNAARKAFALDPTSAEAAQLILRKALEDRQWGKALDCLKVYLNQSGGHTTQEVQKAKALHARLSHQMAQEILSPPTDEGAAPDKGAVKAAILLCEQALAEAPDFVPASALLVRLLAEKGDQKAAVKRATTAFLATPHKDTLAHLRAVTAQNDGQFISAAMTLSAKSEQADEGYLAVAQFAISAGIWASASQAISQISEAYIPTNHYYMVEAAIADSRDDEAAYHNALTQAANAARASTWQCGACGHNHDSYQFDCVACGIPGQMGFITAGQVVLSA